MTSTARLPKPVTEVWDWQLHAACRHTGTAMFFHPENERGNARVTREERAKRVCRECPVMWLCREHALQAEEPYGVWGGLGEQERQMMIAQRHGELRTAS